MGKQETATAAADAWAGVTTPLAVLGIDQGSRWTAGVLRVGDHPVYGWTIGPRNELGEPDRAALDDWDNLPAVTRYVERVLARIDETVAVAQARGLHRVRLATEWTRVPIGYTAGRKTAISLVDWLVPREVTVGILTAYPDTRLVAPDRLGQRPSVEYPVVLRRRRPPDWPASEHPKGERGHERSAYDIAGVAAGMP